MAACVAPLIFYIVQAARSNLFFFQDCLLEVQKVANCTNVFTRTIDDVGDDFVDCDSTSSFFQILTAAYHDSTPTTPIYFILSPGANPVLDV